MLQRNLELESGLFSNVDTRVEYYLQLSSTDLTTGLSIWEGEEPIIKEGSYAPRWGKKIHKCFINKLMPHMCFL